MSAIKESEMSKDQVIEILKYHLIWSRYDGDIGKGPEMQHPKIFGKAVEDAIKLLEAIST